MASSSILKKSFKITAFLLLLINGFSAMYGGWELMNSPNGSAMHLQTAILKHSPFVNFYVPGLVLSVTNGIGSFIVLVIVTVNSDKYPWFIIAQGAILLGWISVQVILLQEVNSLHITFWSVALLLIVSGFALERINKNCV